MEYGFKQVNYEGELPALIRMEEDIFPPEDLYDDPRAEWKKSSAFWIMNGEQRVGYFGVTHNSNVVDTEDEDDFLPGCLYIASVGVLDLFRQQGAATAAMQWILHYAKENGFNRVVDVFRDSNLAARKLHATTGFKFNRRVDEFFENSDGTWETGIVMDLKL